MTVTIGIKKLNFQTRILFVSLHSMETEQERPERLERLGLEKEKKQRKYKDMCARIEPLRLEKEKKEQEFEDLLWEVHKDKPYDTINPTKSPEKSAVFWTLRVRAYKDHLKQFENQT